MAVSYLTQKRYHNILHCQRKTWDTRYVCKTERRCHHVIFLSNALYNIQLAKSTDLGKGPLIPGAQRKSKQINHANQQAAAGSIREITNHFQSSRANIHIHRQSQFIVLQQDQHQGSTADICMYTVFLHHFFFKPLSHFTDKEADVRSSIQNINIPPCCRKVRTDPQLQNCIPCVPPQIRCRTVNRFLYCTVNTGI